MLPIERDAINLAFRAFELSMADESAPRVDLRAIFADMSDQDLVDYGVHLGLGVVDHVIPIELKRRRGELHAWQVQCAHFPNGFLDVRISVLPVAYAPKIEVTIGFTNPDGS